QRRRIWKPRGLKLRSPLEDLSRRVGGSRALLQAARAAASRGARQHADAVGPSLAASRSQGSDTAAYTRCAEAHTRRLHSPDCSLLDFSSRDRECRVTGGPARTRREMSNGLVPLATRRRVLALLALGILAACGSGSQKDAVPFPSARS